MTAVADQLSVSRLVMIGRLLDEAIDLADASGETLLGAQISQVLHVLDARLASVRGDPFARDHGRTDLGGAPGGGIVEG